MRMSQEYLPNRIKEFAIVQKYLVLTSIIMMMVSMSLSSCDSDVPPTLSTKIELGQIAKGIDVYGTYYFYIPTTLSENTESLVLVRGTPKDGTTEENAEFYVKSWKVFAEEHEFILIAPAFNQGNFSSRYGDQAMSGYRGLFG